MIQVIANLAESIAYFLVRKNWGKEEDYEIYQYGCEVILSALIDILLVAGCGLLFHMVGKAFLFYAIFLILRRYCGGFHAETYLVCNSVFTGIVLIALLGISYSTIEEYVVHEAFMQMFNKLYCHYQIILLPIQQSLSELKTRMFSENAHVSNIQLEIAKLREQIHVLATLVTKSFLSSQKYQEQSAQLQTRIAKLQKELFRLTRSDDEDETLEQISGLIDCFENRHEKMTKFEEDTFSQLVDNIIVKDRTELKFCLIGGLQFTEYVTERSKNYG